MDKNTSSYIGPSICDIVKEKIERLFYVEVTVAPLSHPAADGVPHSVFKITGDRMDRANARNYLHAFGDGKGVVQKSVRLSCDTGYREYVERETSAVIQPIDGSNNEYTVRGTDLAHTLAMTLLEDYEVAKTTPHMAVEQTTPKGKVHRRLSTALEQTLIKTNHKRSKYDQASDAVVKAIACCMMATNEEDEVYDDDDVILIEDSEDEDHPEGDISGETEDMDGDDDVMIIETPSNPENESSPENEDRRFFSKEFGQCSGESNNEVTPDKSEGEVDSLTKALEGLQTPSADLAKRGIFKFRPSAAVRPLNFSVESKVPDTHSDNVEGIEAENERQNKKYEEEKFSKLKKRGVTKCIISSKTRGRASPEPEDVHLSKKRCTGNIICITDGDEESSTGDTSSKHKKKKKKKSKSRWDKSPKASRRDKENRKRSTKDGSNKRGSDATKSDSDIQGSVATQGYDKWNFVPTSFEFRRHMIGRSPLTPIHVHVSDTRGVTVVDRGSDSGPIRNEVAQIGGQRRLVSDNVSTGALLDQTDGPKRPLPTSSSSMKEQRNLRYIVIDGSNVAMGHGGNSKEFSCMGIRLAVEYFRNRRHRDITVFLPQWRKCRPPPGVSVTHRHELDRLEEEGFLVYTPSRRIGNKLVASYDDRFIVELAEREDGVIVSNDQYRDLQLEKNSWRRVIETRLLMFTFVRDHFMVPEDPLGRYGPNLDDFLTLDKPPYRFSVPSRDLRETLTRRSDPSYNLHKHLESISGGRDVGRVAGGFQADMLLHRR
ncbi:uncharacterized protein LOC128209624 [Mya arenaria]|uniref:uncharacterized protein LOC128209624 n=1 Tax=Mya arenaria TaxID=6604 RepID=UPI0022E2A748|nr:uncharacterized protein LOC128209624 [Mya arenaria]